jgi:hypothetical protein
MIASMSHLYRLSAAMYLAQGTVLADSSGGGEKLHVGLAAAPSCSSAASAGVRALIKPPAIFSSGLRWYVPFESAT